MRYNTAKSPCNNQVPSFIPGDCFYVVTLPCNNGSRE